MTVAIIAFSFITSNYVGVVSAASATTTNSNVQFTGISILNGYPEYTVGSTSYYVKNGQVHINSLLSGYSDVTDTSVGKSILQKNIPVTNAGDGTYTIKGPNDLTSASYYVKDGLVYQKNVISPLLDSQILTGSPIANSVLKASGVPISNPSSNSPVPAKLQGFAGVSLDALTQNWVSGDYVYDKNGNYIGPNNAENNVIGAVGTGTTASSTSPVPTNLQGLAGVSLDAFTGNWMVGTELYDNMGKYIGPNTAENNIPGGNKFLSAAPVPTNVGSTPKTLTTSILGASRTLSGLNCPSCPPNIGQVKVFDNFGGVAGKSIAFDSKGNAYTYSVDSNTKVGTWTPTNSNDIGSLFKGAGYVDSGSGSLGTSTGTISGEIYSQSDTQKAVVASDGVHALSWDSNANNANGGKGTWVETGTTAATLAANGPYTGGKLFYMIPVPAPGWGQLAEGLTWAATVYGGLQVLGAIIPGLRNYMQPLSQAAAAGIMAFKVAQAFGPRGFNFVHGLNNGWAMGIGAAVAVAVFLLTYKSEKKETVTFTCLPYQPPLGGAKCQQCNTDPFRPCTQYRCESLGQACQLLNQDTPGEEKCAWVNPKDVIAPTIEPLQSALSPSTLEYTPDKTINPPDKGVKIIDKSTSDGCLKAFTPLTFGITTNTSEGAEPSKCKLDFTRNNQTGTAGFDAMQYYFGGNNFFDYNHTQIMSLPGPNETGIDYGPILRNDGTMATYVKCMDANGNVNENDFVFTFCVEKGPDTTPPIIEGTSIVSGGYVSYNADTVPMQVYTNEPAKCRWSRTDEDYYDMKNQMSCASDSSDINAQLTYTCSDNLTSIENSQDNNFFFRCQDYPDTLGAGNNSMQQSYELTLKGSQPLEITDLEPNDTTIGGNTQQVPVTFNVTTSSGADQGNAICYYSLTGENNSFIQMDNTNSYISSQTLDLPGTSAGTSYTFFARCIDAGGNEANAETNITVEYSLNPPIITRAYKQLPDALEIVTNEPATCVYSLNSCNYDFSTGQTMLHPDANTTNVNLANWETDAFYYVKCKDIYGNNPGNDCSLVVSAVALNGENSTS